jgi:hypothetical protein
MLLDGIAPDIRQHLIAGFLPIVKDEVDDLNKLHRTLLSINRSQALTGEAISKLSGCDWLRY